MDETKKSMTVQELIAELGKFNKDLPVAVGYQFAYQRPGLANCDVDKVQEVHEVRLSSGSTWIGTDYVMVVTEPYVLRGTSELC